MAVTQRLRHGDLVAGVSVTAYLVPQVMAYAAIAGLPPEAGLWSAVGALTGYALLGSSPRLSAGPESTTALMTASALAGVGAARVGDLAAALALAVAVLALVAWLGRLGFLAELLSRPVLVGYLAGIAALMAITQLPSLADPAAAMVAVTALGVMVLVALWRPTAPVALLGIVTAVLVASALERLAPGSAGELTRVGAIPATPPTPGLPRVSADEVATLFLPALGLLCVAYTDTVLTGRAFGQRHHESLDSRREFLALAGANLGAGLLHGFPVSSSGSRTALLDAAGGHTRWAGIVTVLATLAAIAVLGPVIAVIPMAGLGAVVLYAAWRLLDVPELRRLARFRRTELLLALATGVGVVVGGVLVGVLVAVGLSLADMLRRVARPHSAVEGYVTGLAGMHDVGDFPDVHTVPGLVVFRWDSPLFFFNAEEFRSRALAAVRAAHPPARWLVLNTEAMSTVDLTAADALESLRRELSAAGVTLALARVKEELRASLAPTGLIDRIGRDHVFPTLPTAVAAFLAAPGEQVLRTGMSGPSSLPDPEPASDAGEERSNQRKEEATP